MQKIVPHLWFDKEAVEAAEFYATAFPDSKVTHKAVIKDTPSGDCDIVDFQVMGFEFMAISAGPVFKINPSISFHIKFKSVEEVDEIWKKLSDGGRVLVPLDKYPFSERYGWLEDKFGISWQVVLAEGDFQKRIIPVLMFTQEICGKAEVAGDFYAEVFSDRGEETDSKFQVFAKYGQGEEPDKEGAVKYGQLFLLGEEFGVMDSAQPHEFKFNEAISLIVKCKDQEEIDYFWEKLSAAPEAEQCGWLKDKYGVSWQIVPIAMGEMMRKGNPEQIVRVTEAFLKMKKFDLKILKQAYEEVR